jgi:AcrR family transcriptional regulator
MARTVGSNGARTEEAIRKAATRLIARHGYEATTLRMLSQAVGIQSAAVYRYFASKQDMLRDLMVQHMSHLLESWEKARPASSDPLQQLVGFVHFHVEYHMDRPDEVFLSYMELRSLQPKNYRVVVDLRRCYELILRNILDRGVKTGQFHVADVKVATMAIIAMMTGINVWYRARGRLSRRRIVEIYTRLVLNSVEADQSAAPEQSGMTLR